MRLSKWLSKTTRKAAQSQRKTPAPEETYAIDFNMMLKGSVYKRRNGNVRQFGVTVNGSTRLVTSGERVNRETYDALLEAGAIREDAIEVGAESSDAKEKRENGDPKKKSTREQAVGS